MFVTITTEKKSAANNSGRRAVRYDPEELNGRETYDAVYTDSDYCYC